MELDKQGEVQKTVKQEERREEKLIFEQLLYQSCLHQTTLFSDSSEGCPSYHRHPLVWEQPSNSPRGRALSIA